MVFVITILLLQDPIWLCILIGPFSEQLAKIDKLKLNVMPNKSICLVPVTQPTRNLFFSITKKK